MPSSRSGRPVDQSAQPISNRKKASLGVGWNRTGLRGHEHPDVLEQRHHRNVGVDRRQGGAVVGERACPGRACCGRPPARDRPPGCCISPIGWSCGTAGTACRRRPGSRRTSGNTTRRPPRPAAPGAAADRSRRRPCGSRADRGRHRPSICCNACTTRWSKIGEVRKLDLRARRDRPLPSAARATWPDRSRMARDTGVEAEARRRQRLVHRFGIALEQRLDRSCRGRSRARSPRARGRPWSGRSARSASAW